MCRARVVFYNGVLDPFANKKIMTLKSYIYEKKQLYIYDFNRLKSTTLKHIHLQENNHTFMGKKLYISEKKAINL